MEKSVDGAQRRNSSPMPKKPTDHTRIKTNSLDRHEKAAPTSDLQRASAMLETCFDAAFIAGTDGIIAGANMACSDLLEIPLQELIGMAADSIYAPPGSYGCSTGETVLISDDHVEKLLDHLAQMLKTGRSSLTDTYCLTRQGLAVPIEQNSVALYNSRGKVSGALTVIHDQTLVYELRSSREPFICLFKKSLDGIIFCDHAGAILMANPAFELLSGHAADEIIGMRFADVALPGPGTYECGNGATEQIGKDFTKKFKETFSRLSEKKTISGWKTWLKKKDHSLVYVELCLATLSGGSNKQPEILCIIKDISEKTSLKDALRKNEERFRIFFEYAPDAIYISDVSGIFLDGNRNAEQLTGYSRDELIGKNYFDLDILSAEQFPRALELLERNSAGSSTGPDEFVLKCRNGSLKTVEICTYPLHIQGERCVLGVAHDITARKKTEAELNTARKSLEHKVRERTRDLEEANTALQVLLKGRDEDKIALEESMLHNLYEFVLPGIEKLKAGKLHSRQRGQLEFLETNLRDITAPMMRAVTMQHLHFTPAEISVANCIRQGKSTRDIAGLLQISIKTVQFHRENIRKKCGIKNKKVNLRTFLASLE